MTPIRSVAIAPASLMKVAPVIFVPFIAALVYMSVNLLAIGYIDEGISVQRTGEDTVHDIVVKNQILPNTDHWPIAYQIIDGQQLSDFRYPPGFAIYMAAAVKAAENWGGSYFFWRLVEDCFSTAGTTVVVMLLMLRLSDSVLVALGAIASLLYNLSFSAGTARDLAMASFLPWFYGGLLLFVGGTQSYRKRAVLQAFFAGVLIGISGFFRPDILLFLPFIAGIFWIHRFLHNTKPLPVIGYNIFVSLIGFGLVLIPWIVFTALRSGTVVVYSTNFIPSHLDGLSRLVGNPVSDIFRWCMSERECMSDLSNISDVIAMHFALFKEYPAHWTDLFLQKVWLPWYGSESQRWNTILALQTLVMLPAILAGIYLWSKKKGLDFALVLGLSVIGYFWLVSIAVLSINRYMPPVYPFLGMFTGFAAHVLCRTHFRLPHMRIN